jgi:putative PEP-CTERM system TPR-repeat lipoprotein
MRKWPWWACLLVLLAACSASNDELLTRARGSMDRGDYRAASIDLKKLLQREPRNAEARYAFGIVSLASGDAGSAARELRVASELGIAPERIVVPLARAFLADRRYDDALVAADVEATKDQTIRAELHVLRGDAQLGANRGAEAVAEFERALAVDDELVRARIGLASAKLLTEGFEAARREADIALKAAPGDVQVRLVNASIYLRDRRFEGAMENYQAAARLAEENGVMAQRAAALAGLCESQLALGRLDDANGTIEQLVELAPEGSITLYLRARTAFLRGDHDHARSDLERILARDPGNRPAQLLLGAVNYVQGNLEQADMHLSGVLAVEPGNNFARRLLTETRLRQRRPREALQAIEARDGPSQGSSGENAMNMALAGTAHIEAGDLDAGLSYLEKAAASTDDPRTIMQLAAGYMAAGRIETAIRILDALKVEGAAGQRRDLLLINARLRADDRAGAIELARALADRQNKVAETQALVGGMLVAAGDRQAARQYFDRALALEPRNPASHINLGKLDLLEGNHAGAEKRFVEALRLKPGHPAAQVAMAQAALARGNRDGAVQWLENARKDNPDAVEPRVLLAQYYLGRRDLPRAETLAGEAIRLSPDNASALNVLGVTLAASGRMRDGVDALSRAVDAQPGSAAARFNLARVYLANGEAEKALEAARESLKLAPQNVQAMALIAALETARGGYGETRRLIGEIRRIDAQYPGVDVLEGELALRTGNAAAAVKAFDAAMKKVPTANVAISSFAARRAAKATNATAPLEQWLATHPNDGRVRLVLSDALSDAGDAEGAVKQLERAVEADADNVVALNNLAMMYQKRGDARSLSMAERAVRIAPKSAAILDTHGWILFQQGRVADALAQLERAVAAAPRDPDIGYHYAAALARNGKNEQAERRLVVLLRDHPAFSEREAAQSLLTQLGGAGSATGT